MIGLPRGAPVVKNPPAKQEIWVQSLSWEDPLEKEMATPSSILAWGIPWTVSLVGYIQSMGSQRVGHNLANNQQQHLHVKCQPHDSQTCICSTVCAQ